VVDPTSDDAAPSVAPSDDEGPLSTQDSQLVEEELLVEDVSIDGMCGVY